MILFIELDIKAAYCKNERGVIGHGGMCSSSELTRLCDGSLIRTALLFQSMSTEEESSTRGQQIEAVWLGTRTQYVYIYICIYKYIQGVPGGKDLTSG